MIIILMMVFQDLIIIYLIFKDYYKILKIKDRFSYYKQNKFCLDLSRFGRDYIMTGYYTEIYFNEKGVRYIAVNDNIDTINDNNRN